MDVKNFYFLLELSVDPPENDVKVIKKAIKAKQAEWSKLRNHPTKGTLAKQYIGLIPEIRKVMLDDNLRKKEAKAAIRQLGKKESKKDSRIDWHISILMRKGHISNEEIEKLARFHSVDRSRIEERIKKGEKLLKNFNLIDKLAKQNKLTDKIINKAAKELKTDVNKLKVQIRKRKESIKREINAYIKRCSIKRKYITKDEITKLAQLYDVDELYIKGRIDSTKCKITGKKEKKAKPLEKAVEIVINDQLKVVGKQNLYDFLGCYEEKNLNPDADLEILQDIPISWLHKKATEKDAHIRSIAKKDAVTTASGVLAGHCLAIFKDKKNRESYDRTLILSRLGELNKEIDAAGLSGKIWPEYMKVLVSKAVRMGMDVQEAYEYIISYCKSKNWKIKKWDKPKTGKKKKLPWWAIAFAIIIICAGMFFLFRTYQENRLKSAYRKTLIKVETEQNLESKKAILENFIRSREKNEYTIKAQNEIKKITRLIEDNDFARIRKNAEKLVSQGKFEEALDAYDAYIDKYPGSPNNSEIQKRIKEISDLVLEKEYRALKASEFKNDVDKIRAYNGFITSYPDSSYSSQLKKEITGIVESHYKKLKTDLERCQNKEKWEECIALCDAFVAKFRFADQAEAVRGFKTKYKNKLQSKLDLEEMKKKAASKGNDYEAARLIYLEYLEANPELPSYSKKLIVNEIKILDKKIAILAKAEKEWEDVLEYSKNEQISLVKRIARLGGFIKKYPDSKHLAEAKSIRDQLVKEKEVEDARMTKEQIFRQWQALLSYSQDPKYSLDERISYVEQYIKTSSVQKYTQKAKKILRKLRLKKAREDERLRQERQIRARKEREKRRIRAIIARSGGQLRDNGDGTITDMRTGLMWCMFDSYIELNACLNYDQAKEYIARLRTGGHSNWRLPSGSELKSVLTTGPVFPSARSKWFWTSKMFWHGWNKMVVIYMINNNNQWVKGSAGAEQCGAVLAVRN